MYGVALPPGLSETLELNCPAFTLFSELGYDNNKPSGRSVDDCDLQQGDRVSNGCDNQWSNLPTDSSSQDEG